jgi:8-oxo-dGTP pyrophosphatase MutT (NUDIX family)
MLYPSAKVVLHDPYDKDRIYLLRREVRNTCCYEPAGGKLELDWQKRTAETLEECARREAKEEMGVDIIVDQYIGSYYFFWSIEQHAFSSCALFAGRILQHDADWANNYDACELPSFPESVLIDDVINGKIAIDPIFVGLPALLIGYLKRYKAEQNIPNAV